MHALNTEERPITVLVIEDNPGDARLIRVLLKDVQKDRFRDIQAGTLAKGMELMRNDNIDIVLLDLGLPDSTGLDTLSKVNTGFGYLPVVIMTGLDDEKTAAAALNMGAQDYLVKGQVDGNMLSRVLLHSIERKRVEESLRREQMMLARTEGIAHIGSWEWDIATDTVTWSDELFRIFQRDQQEGAPSFAEHPSFYHPDGMARLQQAVEAAIADGTPYELELLAIRKDGETRVCMARGVPEMAQDGQPVRLFGSLQDITERKLNEEKLSKSYESLKKTLNDAISTMVKMVEMRDPYTAGHQQKVANLATAIARELKLEDTRIEQLRMASAIHDIGKMYIPSDILSKPGRLSDIEFSLIKAHAQNGYDIVKGMDFPGVVAQAVLQHHERLDGSGYPGGLTNGQVLLESKILAVADVIEAMASHRPYRPALGLEKALDEVEQNSGKLYNPDVVIACLRLFREKSFSFEG